jgi:hypothetical protein
MKIDAYTPPAPGYDEKDENERLLNTAQTIVIEAPFSGNYAKKLLEQLKFALLDITNRIKANGNKLTKDDYDALVQILDNPGGFEDDLQEIHDFYTKNFDELTALNEDPVSNDPAFTGKDKKIEENISLAKKALDKSNAAIDDALKALLSLREKKNFYKESPQLEEADRYAGEASFLTVECDQIKTDGVAIRRSIQSPAGNLTAKQLGDFTNQNNELKLRKSDADSKIATLETSLVTLESDLLTAKLPAAAESAVKAKVKEARDKLVKLKSSSSSYSSIDRLLTDITLDLKVPTSPENESIKIEISRLHGEILALGQGIGFKNGNIQLSIKDIEDRIRANGGKLSQSDYAHLIKLVGSTSSGYAGDLEAMRKDYTDKTTRLNAIASKAVLNEPSFAQYSSAIRDSLNAEDRSLKDAQSGIDAFSTFLGNLKDKGSSFESSAEKTEAVDMGAELDGYVQDLARMKTSGIDLNNRINAVPGRFTVDQSRDLPAEWKELDDERVAMETGLTKRERRIKTIESSLGSLPIPIKIQDEIKAALSESKKKIADIRKPRTDFAIVTQLLSDIRSKIDGKIEKIIVPADVRLEVDKLIDIDIKDEHSRVVGDLGTKQAELTTHLTNLNPTLGVSLDGPTGAVQKAKDWLVHNVNIEVNVLERSMAGFQKRLNDLREDIRLWENNPATANLLEREREVLKAKLEAEKLQRLTSAMEEYRRMTKEAQERVDSLDGPGARITNSLDALLKDHELQLKTKQEKTNKKWYKRFWEKYNQDPTARAAMGAATTTVAILANFVPFGQAAVHGGVLAMRVGTGALGGASMGDTVVQKAQEGNALKRIHNADGAFDEGKVHSMTAEELTRTYFELTGIASQKGLQISSVLAQADLAHAEREKEKSSGPKKLMNMMRDMWAKTDPKLKFGIGVSTLALNMLGPAGVLGSAAINTFLSTLRKSEDVYRRGYQYSSDVEKLHAKMKELHLTMSDTEKDSFNDYVKHVKENKGKQMAHNRGIGALVGLFAGGGLVGAGAWLKNHQIVGSDSESSPIKVDNAGHTEVVQSHSGTGGAETSPVAPGGHGGGSIETSPTPKADEVFLHLKNDPTHNLPNSTGHNTNLHIAQEILQAKDDSKGLPDLQRHVALAHMVDRMNGQEQGSHFNTHTGSLLADTSSKLGHDVHAVDLRDEALKLANSGVTPPQVMETQTTLDGFMKLHPSLHMDQHHKDALFMAAYGKMRDGHKLSEPEFNNILASIKDPHPMHGFGVFGAANVHHSGGSVNHNLHSQIDNHRATLGNGHNHGNGHDAVSTRSTTSSPTHSDADVNHHPATTDSTDKVDPKDVIHHVNDKKVSGNKDNAFDSSAKHVSDTKDAFDSDGQPVNKDDVINLHRGNGLNTGAPEKSPQMPAHDNLRQNSDLGNHGANPDGTMLSIKGPNVAKVEGLQNQLNNMIQEKSVRDIFYKHNIPLSMFGEIPPPFKALSRAFTDTFMHGGNKLPDTEKLAAFQAAITRVHDATKLGSHFSSDDLYDFPFLRDVNLGGGTYLEDRIMAQKDPTYEFLMAHVSKMMPDEQKIAA